MNTKLEEEFDINDQKQIFETIFYKSIDGILIIEDGMFVECNDSVVHMLKYKNKTQFLNTHPSELSPEFQPNGRSSFAAAEESIRVALEKGSHSFEWVHKKADEQEFWVWVVLTNISTKDKTRFLVIWRDIDEKKKMEGELKELNKNLENRVKEAVEEAKEKELQLYEMSKMAQMGEMIENIAHQWRQPLGAISAVANSVSIKQMLGNLNPEDISEYMQEIEDYTQYLSQTIDTFRNFIKDSKELQEVILQEYIDSTLYIIDSTIKTNNIKLIKEIDYLKSINISMILGELSQVIINIINNAKDILLEREIKNPWIKLVLKEQDNKAIITIEDNAGGIPEEVLPKIFEPYFTTKHKSHGTGLGLHMSYKIISQSFNGRLYARNTENGAKFFIELPL